MTSACSVGSAICRSQGLSCFRFSRRRSSLRIRDARGNRRSGARTATCDSDGSCAPGAVADRSRGLSCAGDRLRVIAEERHGRSGGGGPSSPLAIAAALVASRLADAGRRSSLPLRSCSSSCARAVHIYAQARRPVPRTRLDAVRPSRSGRRAVLASLRRRRQAVSGHRRRPRLQDIRALDALYVERYWRYVKTFVRAGRLRPVHGRRSSASTLPENPMFDALGVRAVLSKRDLATVPALRYIGRDRDTRVYENTGHIRGRGSCTTSTSSGTKTKRLSFSRRMRGDEDGAFIVDSFDPQARSRGRAQRTSRRTKLARTPGRAGDCTERGPDRATIERYSADSVSLRVETACAGLLVLPDTYFPGWKATVNGRDRRSTRPTARSEVSLCRRAHHASNSATSREPSRSGCLLAVAGLVGFLALGLARWSLAGSRRGKQPMAQVDNAGVTLAATFRRRRSPAERHFP